MTAYNIADADGIDWRGSFERQKSRAEKAEKERDSWESIAQQTARSIDALRAEQPNPLTPEAVESVLHDILPLTTEHLKADDIANIAYDLHAALTEPTRPEGAEELETVLGLNAGEWTNGGAQAVRALADLLASHGVRATGGN